MIAPRAYKNITKAGGVPLMEKTISEKPKKTFQKNRKTT
jgi:hypothetical protein